MRANGGCEPVGEIDAEADGAGLHEDVVELSKGLKTEAGVEINIEGGLVFDDVFLAVEMMYGAMVEAGMLARVNWGVCSRSGGISVLSWSWADSAIRTARSIES